MKIIKAFTISTILLMGSYAFAAANPAATKPTDAEISKIVTTVNNGEISLAEKVLKSTKNDEVRKFAEHMVHDHGQNNEKAKDLAAKIDLKPTDSRESKTLKNDSMKNKEKLAGLEGKELDKAYMNSQVKGHQKVLDELNQKLIPSATNPELKTYLEKTAKKVSEHLEDAKRIQSHLL